MRDPADTRNIVASAPRATRAQAIEAVQVAVRGSLEWRAVPAIQRGEVIRRASEIIAERAEQLAVAATLEMGKPIAESRGEAARAVEHARYFSTVGREAQGYTANLNEPDAQAFTLRSPIGVVSVITPWNFPIMIPNWKIAPALAHGNSVILKPAEVSPVTATLLVQCYLDAGVPASALSLLIGKSSEIGDVLLTAPEIAGVTFTGSTEVGRKISATAVGLGKRVQAEMGGKNALVIMDDANLDKALEAVMVGGFGTSGQRCTSSSRILVHEAVFEEVQRRLTEAVGQLRVGHGLTAGINAGPLASESALEDVMQGLERAVADGATVVAGGSRAEDSDLANGWFLQPTLLTGPATGAAFSEEIFGPIVSLHSIKDIDEAIRLNNEVEYGLSASIYTSNLEAANRFIFETDTGMVHVNRPTVGAEPHLPFGGSKASAIGPSELGAAHQFFTKTRSAHVRWKF
ncbi:aldehyde dehydrogenase family protein [Leucobacter sp. Z1108]|uniref:aldehyde dehydrogenase family protein n=1 Tax=Leucobacter sp. Z1108 TaxID=3439066 RepID=UPI00403DCA5A